MSSKAHAVSVAENDIEGSNPASQNGQCVGPASTAPKKPSAQSMSTSSPSNVKKMRVPRGTCKTCRLQEGRAPPSCLRELLWPPMPWGCILEIFDCIDPDVEL
ncbi:hypothetical protein EG328_002538 [Venturia inaequalis]|uniref:Uncharacterized protein n=1 Tax=Venturia inaequalis TaxID=5025 RepID=A0A8H3UUP1_VENIN|nr:hypothetical protein EG328_002538 [Venturia inaequalis]KAE9993624.1 hypothetical protein EG327_004145 [Venturia inaequalis]